VTASTFSGNSATPRFIEFIGYDSGGGIDNRGGTLTVIASTFSGNSAKFGGGGVYNDSRSSLSTLTIRNTLLAGNTAQIGDPDVDVVGAVESLGHNLIGDGSGGSGYAATDLVGTSANPIDPKLGPLQDNGGPTQTMALLPGSPAISAGGLTDSEWDQRGPGFARSVNGMTDIGAYEVQQGQGAAALALHSADPTDHVPVMGLSHPSTLSIPLRPVAATVDRVFASWTSEAATLILGRSRHPALVEQDLWRFVPICGVTQ
jgi:hypothetical protein